EVADRRRPEDPGLHVIRAGTKRRRRECGVRRDGEAGDGRAVAVQRVDLVAVHGDDLRIAVAVEVRYRRRREAAVAGGNRADGERGSAHVGRDERWYRCDERRAAIEVQRGRTVGVVDGDLTGGVRGDELEAAVAVEVRHAQALLAAGVGEPRPADVERRVVI